ncbi:MAG: LPS assembly lipoprotein LptE [Phycisphaerales bacterium]
MFGARLVVRRVALFCSALAIAITLPACGSKNAEGASAGYTFGSGHRTDIRTVAVPIFENRTFTHGLEMQLTEAIVKEIHRVTPWRVAPRDGAETVLTGAITGADIRKLSSQRDSGLLQEGAVELAVNFEWKSTSDGKVLVGRRNFRAAEPFVPARGAQERLEVGQISAIDQMAKDIVSELRGSW